MGLPDSCGAKQEKSTTVLAVVFHPPSVPLPIRSRLALRVSPFVPPVLLRHLRLAFMARLPTDLGFPLSFRPSFCSLYTSPYICLLLALCVCVCVAVFFSVRFPSACQHRSILSGRSSLDHWPERKLARFNPLWSELHPDWWAELRFIHSQVFFFIRQIYHF